MEPVVDKNLARRDQRQRASHRRASLWRTISRCLNCLAFEIPSHHKHSDEETPLELLFSWFEKRSNRLPEALWLTFQPVVAESRSWTMSKLERFRLAI